MKKVGGNNIIKVNSKSLSLSKINPYYQNKDHYLPYKYKDPSFKTKYNGLLLKRFLSFQFNEKPLEGTDLIQKY